MGSWSVYCGLSNMTIRSGQECVLLVIKKNNEYKIYQPYLPYSLPIYGEYDDYGGIQNIEENFNTKLIEKVYGCDIDDFCRNLIERDEEDSDSKLDYMWIDRKVFDFLSSPFSKSYGGIGQFDMGNEELLSYLGFTYVGKSKDKRYNKTYEFGGKKVNTDGTWLQKGIYNIFNLKKEFPELDTKGLENKYKQNTFEIHGKKWRIEKLGYVIGIDHNDLFWLYMKEDFKKLKSIIDPTLLNEDKEDTEGNKYVTKAKAKYSGLLGEYLNLFEDNDFCSELAKLSILLHNIYSFSGIFTPYVLYITPQCGEYKTHQLILEKFAEINKQNFDEDDDE